MNGTAFKEPVSILVRTGFPKEIRSADDIHPARSETSPPSTVLWRYRFALGHGRVRG